MNFTDPTVIMFSIYLFAMLFIGILGYRRTKSLDDYILGGRSLGSFVTALSAGASDMSGWLLMGLPGAIYLSGVSEAWIGVGLVLGAYLNWRFVAARLRLYTERAGNALTLVLAARAKAAGAVDVTTPARGPPSGFVTRRRAPPPCRISSAWT